MHFILRGLSRIRGGTMSKDWIYVGYNIFTRKANTVDLQEVMWQDFRKFVDKKKPKEFPIPRFWALNLQ